MQQTGHRMWSWLLGCLLISACEQLDPAEALPIYLEIPQVQVQLNASGTQISSLGIKDLWVDYGPEQLGAFKVPFTIPIIPRENQDTLLLRGGVFESGFSSVRTAYPFWQGIKIPLQGEALDTIRLSPQLRYFPQDSVLRYPLVEGFEGAALEFVDLLSGPTITSLNRSAEDAFLGQRSGKAAFSSSRYHMEVVAADYIPLPQSGNNDVWVEITYKNDIPFTMGLFYLFGNTLERLESGVSFNSDLEWNTVYIHLNDLVRSVPQGSGFKLYFQASSLDAETGRGRAGSLFLDQIRIVHFR